jgi:cob(I)alamin adenosyltransferase
MKLYTRTGDQGLTGLFGGDRVKKSHSRIQAYGTLDELNSVIGVLRLYATPIVVGQEVLSQIQHDLFVLGAVLATPESQLGRLGEKMTKPTWGLEDMETDIDRLSALAPPMKNFVLPGGLPAAAYGHLARTVCRRAEREVVLLTAEEVVPNEVIMYLNRLSDWLFALSRAENSVAGIPDVEWLPR